MSDVVWAKVYLELPTDPKLIGRSAHDCYLWVCLILLAKANTEQTGIVPAWQARTEYLSKYARISLKETAAALAYFEAVDMVQTDPSGVLILPKFQKRQAKSDPTAAQRQRDKRAKERDCHADVTRDSHDTRGREEAEADRNPKGLLVEADTSVGPSDQADDEVCVSGVDLGVFGSDERAAPMAPAIHGQKDHTERDSAFTDLHAAYPPNPRGNPWAWGPAREAWNLHVPPGSEPAVLAKLALYVASDDVKRGHVMAPANWLPNWRDQAEPKPVAPNSAKAASTVPNYLARTAS